MANAYQELIGRLKEKGIRSKMHQLDNKCSQESKNVIKGNNMEYQLLPPYNHSGNIADKAIQIFKDHFMVVLCGTYDSMPLQLRCQLLC